MEQLSIAFNTSGMTAAAAALIPTVFGPAASGAVFTRPEVVDFILDLIGYAPELPLYDKRLLEPSFGGGAFLLPAIRRLFKSWRRNHCKEPTPSDLKGSICAVELHSGTYENTRRKIVRVLENEGIRPGESDNLAAQWLVRGDFLLTSIDCGFDFVAGNPPYIRQEAVPDHLLLEYRRRYATMYDRADLYVPFIERSLSLLKKGGVLGFICADRWIKNRYGGPLRKLIASKYRLKVYVDMTDTDAFHSEVSAYPAITIIGREPAGSTRIACRPEIDGARLSALVSEILSPVTPETGGLVREVRVVMRDSEPWLLGTSGCTSIIRRMEEDLPALEETGCGVGIGVATGADRAFIGEYEALDVEPDRKLPLVMTKDIISGKVSWLGKGVINPFADDGSLVDLKKYPRLRRYLEDRRDIIANRHCARKDLRNWYRTIDRIYPSLASMEKLLIPDIKSEMHVVYEQGELYPHHNLYYITSTEWDLRALQSVLLSSVSRLFISAYSTKMRGGYLRFQAQYLRRIRIPKWEDVPESLRKKLAKASLQRDLSECDSLAFELYGLNDEEQLIIRKSGKKNDVESCRL